MESPTKQQLIEAFGISPTYAHYIVTGDRDPARPLAIAIYRKFQWRTKPLLDLSDEQIDMLEQIDPWTPSKVKAA